MYLLWPRIHPININRYYSHLLLIIHYIYCNTLRIIWYIIWHPFAYPIHRIPYPIPPHASIHASSNWLIGNGWYLSHLSTHTANSLSCPTICWRKLSLDPNTWTALATTLAMPSNCQVQVNNRTCFFFNCDENIMECRQDDDHDSSCRIAIMGAAWLSVAAWLWQQNRQGTHKHKSH